VSSNFRMKKSSIVLQTLNVRKVRGKEGKKTWINTIGKKGEMSSSL